MSTTKFILYIIKILIGIFIDNNDGLSACFHPMECCGIVFLGIDEWNDWKSKTDSWRGYLRIPSDTHNAL